MSPFRAESIAVSLSTAGCEVRRGAERQLLPVGEGMLAWPAELATHLPVGARVRAQVADRALRYLVLQWPAAVSGRKERDAWLAHQFKQVHGIDVAAWVIGRDTDAVSDPFIACAMPRALVDGLQAIVGARKGRVQSLTGRFVSQFNAVASRIDAADGALVTIEDGRLMLGVWRDGRWGTVLSRAVGEDASLARRELAQLRVTGEASETGVLYQLGASVEAPAGWTRVALESA